MIVRFLVNRLLLSLLTLWLLSVIVFIGSQLLPGNVGRAILGPLADAQAVANLNAQLGTDRPILVQYWDWLDSFVVGDMGMSYAFRQPAAPMIATALLNSLKLASVAFLIVVPLSIAAGVWAALHVDRWLDRLISIGGLSLSVLPEFVTGIVLILVFGVWNSWLPITATWPEGAGFATQLHHLLLPSFPLVLVLFGYFARMVRAGTIEALDSDYTRTAVLKGLPRRTVIWRHVLRNALLPTIAVTATQVGYLVGGLVVVEVLFRYQGIGQLIYQAARLKDFPLLEAGILTVGIVYTIATILADLLQAALNPRIRLGDAA